MSMSFLSKGLDNQYRGNSGPLVNFSVKCPNCGHYDYSHKFMWNGPIIVVWCQSSFDNCKCSREYAFVPPS